MQMEDKIKKLEELFTKRKEIDSEIYKLIGGVSKKTKPKVSSDNKDTTKRRKREVTHECCGSKNKAHKVTCDSMKEEAPKLNFECIDCDAKVKGKNLEDATQAHNINHKLIQK